MNPFCLFICPITQLDLLICFLDSIRSGSYSIYSGRQRARPSTGESGRVVKRQTVNLFRSNPSHVGSIPSSPTSISTSQPDGTVSCSTQSIEQGPRAVLTASPISVAGLLCLLLSAPNLLPSSWAVGFATRERLSSLWYLLQPDQTPRTTGAFW